MAEVESHDAGLRHAGDPVNGGKFRPDQNPGTVRPEAQFASGGEIRKGIHQRREGSRFQIVGKPAERGAFFPPRESVQLERRGIG